MFFICRVSSGPELIQIQPIYEDDNDCSYKCEISAISREKVKKTAIVLAESRETGELLRCDVIIDLITSFAVHTTTRELYLEEAPETFELKAQDSQGNDFTTLEGIEFQWKLGLQSRNTKDQSGHARQQVLRFLTFSESKYHQVSLSNLDVDQQII
jgi:nuclear pore complex protein Nup210